MYFLTIVSLILVIAMIFSIIGLQSSILIKDLSAKRYSILLFLLMIFASIVSRIISGKTQSSTLGFISGPLILLIGFMPVLYCDYLRKQRPASYTGIWKNIGNWMDSPIKTLFSRK